MEIEFRFFWLKTMPEMRYWWAKALGDCPIQINLTVAPRDGEQALSILSEPDYKPALIILDLNIPKLPGHTLLQRYDAKKTPVVNFLARTGMMSTSIALSSPWESASTFHKPTDLDAL